MQELQMLEDWIPEQMEPGTLFVLANAGATGPEEDPFYAVMSCPTCASLGLITRQQFRGAATIICGSQNCSTEFSLRGDDIEYRRPQ